MSTTKIIAIVLSALALAALAAWFVAARYKGSPAAAPAAVVGVPTQPAIEAVKPEKRAGKKSAVSIKPAALRKRRVSRLQEPGEALGGGRAAGLEADATAVSHQ